MASGSVEINKLSDETFDLLCTMCKQDGRNTEAVKYCTDCSDYYCSKCIKVHDTVPVLKGHKIVDKGQFPKGSSKSLLIVPTERCERHGLKPVDMYCENHDGVGCPSCMAVEHRLCQDIFYIPEYILNTASTCNPRDIERELKSTEKTLAENLRHFEQEVQQAIDRKAKSIQSIRQFRKEIEKRLDELEQVSVDEIEEKYKVMIGKLEEEIRIIKETKTKVTSAQDKLASAGNNVSQVFVSTKMGHVTAIDAEKCLEQRRTGSQKEEISFTPDQKLSAMLKDMKAFGQTVQQFSKRAAEKQKVIAKHKGALFQIKGMKNYRVKDQSDSEDCNILSSCILEDGTIILADHYNKKLKRLDRSTYCVRDHYNLPKKPCQVCAINTQEVAVSYMRREIMFISLGNQMTQKSLIKTDFDCHALAYGNDNLYISDWYTSVYIYSMSGRKLRKFDKDQSGDALFSGSWQWIIFSLAVSEDGAKIYVANSRKGLIVLDNNGKVVVKFNDPKLDWACDVHLTSSGDVLVCGKNSKNVLQFGPDGELLGEIVKGDGGAWCSSVCCDQQMSKMIVGRYDTNEIAVYDLV